MAPAKPVNQSMAPRSRSTDRRSGGAEVPAGWIVTLDTLRTQLARRDRPSSIVRVIQYAFSVLASANGVIARM
jgi:hypothetical protein